MDETWSVSAQLRLDRVAQEQLEPGVAIGVVTISGVKISGTAMDFVSSFHIGGRRCEINTVIERRTAQPLDVGPVWIDSKVPVEELGIGQALGRWPLQHLGQEGVDLVHQGMVVETRPVPFE